MPPRSSIWPDFMLPFMRWLAVNQISDLLSLLGVVGVLLTFAKVLQSTRAVEAARSAAEAARNSVQYVTVLADFATGIAILEEIKRFHRSQVLEPLPTLRSVVSRAQGESDLHSGVSFSRNAVTIENEVCFFGPGRVPK